MTTVCAADITQAGREKMSVVLGTLLVRNRRAGDDNAAPPLHERQQRDGVAAETGADLAGEGFEYVAEVPGVLGDA